MTEEYHEYVIVGAGISAMQAGILLAHHNRDFIILEATGKIGGRIATDRLGDVVEEEQRRLREGGESVGNDNIEWLVRNK